MRTAITRQAPGKLISTRQLVGAAALFALLLIPHVGLRGYIIDDAYIHLRIAAHLVRTGYPYFNVGEAVNASSSPVWTLLLALILFIGRFHLVAVALLEALISTFGTIAFVALINSAIPLKWFERLIVGACYLAITLPSSTGWMEMPLALLVMSVALLRYKSDHLDAFFLLGVLPFIRPEFAGFAILVLCHAIFRRRYPLGKFLPLCLAGAAPFIIYELVYFRSIIPNTIIAKARVYHLSYDEVFGQIKASLIPPVTMWPRLHATLAASPWIVMVLPAMGIGLSLGFSRRQPQRMLSAIFLLFTAVLLGTYVLARSFQFPWYTPAYLVPLLGVLCLSLWGTLPPPINYAVRLLAAPTLAMWLLVLVQVGLASFHPYLAPAFAVNARTRAYLRIGADLSRTYPNARIMGAEIGALGYSFPGYVLDGAGLVTPSALKYHPLPVPEMRSSERIGAIPRAFIESEQPEIIVSMPLFLEDFHKHGDLSRYALFRRPVYLSEDAIHTSGHLWGTDKIDVYIRYDILAAAHPRWTPNK